MLNLADICTVTPEQYMEDLKIRAVSSNRSRFVNVLFPHVQRSPRNRYETPRADAFRSRNKSVFTSNQIDSIISDTKNLFDRKRNTTILQMNQISFKRKQLEKSEQALEDQSIIWDVKNAPKVSKHGKVAFYSKSIENPSTRNAPTIK